MNSSPISIEIEGAVAPDQTTPSNEQSLEYINLREEAAWLYDDITKLSRKVQYQDHVLTEKDLEIQELKTVLFTTKNDNGDLKRKLQEQDEREAIHTSTLDECVRRKEEVCILQKRLKEGQQWREQAERNDKEIQELKQRLAGQQMMHTHQQCQMNDLHNQIQTIQAMYDMESTARKAAERRVKTLEDMLRVLLRQEPTENEDTCNVNSGGRFKRQRLPECRRCHTSLPSDSGCSYHDKAPLHLLVKDSNSHVIRVGQQKFWPCCGKTSIKEPEGCKTRPFHDTV